MARHSFTVRALFVLHLKEVDKFTYDAIAQLTGVSKQSVEYLCKYTSEKIREKYNLQPSEGVADYARQMLLEAQDLPLKQEKVDCVHDWKDLVSVSAAGLDINVFRCSKCEVTTATEDLFPGMSG